MFVSWSAKKEMEDCMCIFRNPYEYQYVVYMFGSPDRQETIEQLVLVESVTRNYEGKVLIAQIREYIEEDWTDERWKVYFSKLMLNTKTYLECKAEEWEAHWAKLKAEMAALEDKTNGRGE